MAAKKTVPDVGEIRSVLAMLLDKPMTVKVARGEHDPRMAVMSVYVHDDDRAAAVLAVDVPLAAALGAALGLLPAQQATAAVKAARLPDSLAANFYEVANVLAASLCTSLQEHVRLREVVHAPAQIAADLAARLSKPPHRIDLEVTIQGYGGGKATLLAF